jgi:hypothetical protein
MSDIVRNDERRIIQEKNVSAIVREENPESIRRWDIDVERLTREHNENLRATAVRNAVNIMNADAYYERGKAADFFGDVLAPLADRIYEYITQDSSHECVGEDDGCPWCAGYRWAKKQLERE